MRCDGAVWIFKLKVDYCFSMFRYKDDLQSYIILYRERRWSFYSRVVQHIHVCSRSGGVTSQTCSEPLLMDRFTDVHMEQVEVRFRTKVQGEHEFTRDIKAETWTQIKLYCWKHCTSTWKTFLLSAIHMTVEWANYNRLTAELRVKQADSYRCSSWCVFRGLHANTCVNNPK